MFHSYRRLNKERAKQRAINFDGDVVDRVFPAAKDDDNIELELKYETDEGVESKLHRIKRQEKNWRLEGNCPKDKLYDLLILVVSSQWLLIQGQSQPKAHGRFIHKITK